ncbi:MAG: hypothetical protein A2571_01455 [Candidatus Vogelbacteria bacterium RIFOXYD1_FULL_44_32]|uniref:Glycosyl transferase family 1 domain-containing protein n=1 Tax=Candidatus Vogelbacteria bacterium RIFOXYD1_FULL_44_32 TaxID=1802438 RepID=A0A1G2QDB5_9BACT|nr:MAG: hypothetical protein A2571_01455 [Candidatus Vogelbacteria bacterium RIFOXYD1_FULL_44_32]
MKFVFIAPRFHTNFYYLVKTLLDHGHQVDFLALYEGKSEDHSLVKPIIVGKPNSRWPLIIKLIKQILFSQADVLIIKDIVTPYSLIALTTGFLLRKKMLALTQIPKYRAQLVSGAVTWLWRVFHTEAITPVQGDLRFSNGNPTLWYVPFVIEANDKPYEAHPDVGQINILCVGKFQTRKNQLLLVQAVEQLCQEFPLKLLLAGEVEEFSYFEKLQHYIHNHNLDSIVTIVPHLPWAKMSDLYRASDIFVLPSSGEPAAYSILEAMSYGLPVVSSDDNGTQWYIKSNSNGFIFRHDDLADLILKLRTILGDKAKLKVMGGVSLQLTKQLHQPVIFYQKVMAIIN